MYILKHGAYINSLQIVQSNSASSRKPFISKMIKDSEYKILMWLVNNCDINEVNVESSKVLHENTCRLVLSECKIWRRCSDVELQPVEHMWHLNSELTCCPCVFLQGLNKDNEDKHADTLCWSWVNNMCLRQTRHKRKSSSSILCENLVLRSVCQCFFSCMWAYDTDMVPPIA